MSIEYTNVIQIYAVPSDFSFIMHQNWQLLRNLLGAYKLWFHKPSLIVLQKGEQSDGFSSISTDIVSGIKATHSSPPSQVRQGARVQTLWYCTNDCFQGWKVRQPFKRWGHQRHQV